MKSCLLLCTPRLFLKRGLLYIRKGFAPVDAQADLTLGWSHKSYCRFCRVLAHI